MAVSEADLSTVLRHCRSLLDASSQLEAVRAGRAIESATTVGRWRGDHRDVFQDRLEDEAADFRKRAAELRDDADAWAQLWADAVNGINAERRRERVAEVGANRGLGEKAFDFVDIFHGDDSADQVRPFVPVAVPTAASRYAATGRLETF